MARRKRARRQQQPPAPASHPAESKTESVFWDVVVEGATQLPARMADSLSGTVKAASNVLDFKAGGGDFGGAGTSGEWKLPSLPEVNLTDISLPDPGDVADAILSNISL